MWFFLMAGVAGIEPTQSDLKAEVLPLNYTPFCIQKSILKNITVKFYWIPIKITIKFKHFSYVFDKYYKSHEFLKQNEKKETFS